MNRNEHYNHSGFPPKVKLMVTGERAFSVVTPAMEIAPHGGSPGSVTAHL